MRVWMKLSITVSEAWPKTANSTKGSIGNAAHRYAGKVNFLLVNLASKADAVSFGEQHGVTACASLCPPAPGARARPSRSLQWTGSAWWLHQGPAALSRRSHGVPRRARADGRPSAEYGIQYIPHKTLIGADGVVLQVGVNRLADGCACCPGALPLLHPLLHPLLGEECRPAEFPGGLGRG
jgi:hypothetical protein